MGLKPSSQTSVTASDEFDTGPERKAKCKYYKSFKRILKAGLRLGLGRTRRTKFLRPQQTQTQCLDPPSLGVIPLTPAIPLIPSIPPIPGGVILPNMSSPMKPSPFPSEKGLKKSRHSLLSYALSRLAILSDASISKDNSQKNSRQFTFHKFRKEAPPPIKPEILPKGENAKANNENDNRKSKTRLDTNNNAIDISAIKEEIVRDLLSPRNATRATTTEEIYRQNLEKFEKILACTVPTSDEDASDYFDENNNYVRREKKASEKLSRVIATSKNRVEVDAYFLEWLSKMRSNIFGGTKEVEKKKSKSKVDKKSKGKKVHISESPSKTKKPGKEQRSHISVTVNKAGETRRSKDSKKAIDPNNNASKKSPAASKTKVSSSNASKSKLMVKEVSTKSKNKEQPKPRSRSTSEYSESSSRRIPQRRNPPWDRGRSRISHACGGKGCYPSAPPAYLDYGGSAKRGPAGKKTRDVVMERIKNVDVVEELTYMMPNGGNGDACCDEEDDDCDYYAVCESCGEMEPIPDEVKMKIKNDGKGKCETTPVTYSRRQRFNFKNKDDEDDDGDGPPYPYEGLQCPNCRCTCCVAGSRRNPNCNCQCCQTMGNARRCSSFDEFPVGKNPQIRRVLCPDEERKLFREECDKHIPEESGMYKYDEEEESYVRQVPRTPSPIIVEVPKPRPLRKHELQAIAGQAIKKPKYESQCPPCPPEPMYLPPIFGQCNNYPGCCAPNKDKDSNNNRKSTDSSGTSESTGKSS